MTRIDFHSGPASPIDYAYRLVRKAYMNGHRVVVVSDDQDLTAAIDVALWTHQPTDFLPHCTLHAEECGETPIVLAGVDDETPHHEILINLGKRLPTWFSRFERVIEIVLAEPDAVAAGRERWAFYRDRGYALQHHDARASGS